MQKFETVDPDRCSTSFLKWIRDYGEILSNILRYDFSRKMFLVF